LPDVDTLGAMIMEYPTMAKLAGTLAVAKVGATLGGLVAGVAMIGVECARYFREKRNYSGWH